MVQGAAVSNRRLEAAADSAKPFASMTELRSKVAYVNPRAVTYVEQGPENRGGPTERDANAVVCFIGGTVLPVLQGSNIVNKRLEEARAALGTFAALTDTGGKAVFVNHGAITHVSADISRFGAAHGAADGSGGTAASGS